MELAPLLVTLIVCTLSFMLKAESLLPPYQFGVYDVLVLPPSFPFGGMVRHVQFMAHSYAQLCVSQENACLTFLTPSKIPPAPYFGVQ